MFWYRWAPALAGPCGPFENHSHHHQGRCRPVENRGQGWGSGFGVRRPLRFMVRELDLSPQQAESLAAILDDLKTQRAQAAVDHKKALAAISDALVRDTLDVAAIDAATKARAASAAAVEQAVAAALERTHALLSADQRRRLAYLLRTEALTI